MTENSPTNEVLTNEIHSKNGTWLQLSLNRPKALNALSLSMINSLQSELKKAESNTEILGVVLDSSTEKAFCAGGDVKGVVQDILSGNPNSARTYFSAEYQLDGAIHSFSKPLVVWLSGYVFGGGVGLSVGGKFRVVTPQTLFSMPESKIGFFPDVGASLFLGRMPWPIGLFASWSGFRFNPDDAIAYGLADYKIDSTYKKEFLSFLTEIESNEGYGINQELRSWFLNHNIEGQSPLFETEFEHLKTISPDKSPLECFKLFLELKNNTYFKPWIEQIENASPTSMIASYAQMKWAHKKRAAKESFSINEALNAELALAEWTAKQPDFANGVKALLIDKTDIPNWHPTHIEELLDQQESLVSLLEDNKNQGLFS